MRVDRHSSVQPALSPCRVAGVKEYRPSAVCHPASLRRPWVYPSREIAQRNRDAPYFGVGKVRLRIDRVSLNIFRALGVAASTRPGVLNISPTSQQHAGPRRAQATTHPVSRAPGDCP